LELTEIVKEEKTSKKAKDEAQYQTELAEVKMIKG
jgi:hypothetical protein